VPIFPAPLLTSPMAELSFVQLKIVFGTIPEKITGFVVRYSQFH
jgi:hypothetical protein